MARCFEGDLFGHYGKVLGNRAQDHHYHCLEEAASSSISVPAFKPPGVKPPQTSGWQGGLSQYLARPSALQPFIFMDTREYMVIYDGYPKARIHLLMVPKPSYLNIDSIATLRREHLDK